MQRAVGTFKALSDPNRIRILKMLEVKPLCVCEITAALQLAASTVSNHLAILRDAGFISNEKDGKWVNYRLDEPARNSYVRDLRSLLTTWLNNDDIVRTDQEHIRQVDRYDICNTDSE